jgi:hypothetical protein
MQCAIDCSPFHESCLRVNLNKLFTVLKYTFRVYVLVHGVPMLLSKSKRTALLKQPLSSLKKLLKSILLSMCFLGGFVMVTRSFSCIFANLRGKFDVLNVFAMSVFATLPVLLENVSRMESYTGFCLPKVLEGLWDLLQKLGYVRNFKLAMPIVFAMSMALLLVLKKHYTKDMPNNYLGLMAFFFGKEPVEDVKNHKSINDRHEIKEEAEKIKETK